MRSPEGSKEITVIKITSGPFKPSITEAGVERARAVWNELKKKLDKNQDRRISRAETSHIPAWRNLFGKVDKNGNGSIGEGEYITYFLEATRGGGAKGSSKGGKSRPGVRPQGRPQPR